jgi:hypothetical protein
VSEREMGRHVLARQLVHLRLAIAECGVKKSYLVWIGLNQGARCVRRENGRGVEREDGSGWVSESESMRGHLSHVAAQSTQQSMGGGSE